MKKIKDIHKGNLLVESDVRLDGVVTGNVNVASGGYFELHGMVNGSLSVQDGGSADVSGSLGRLGSVTGDGLLLIAVGSRVGDRVLGHGGSWVKAEGMWMVDDSTPRFAVLPDGSLSPAVR